MRFGNLLRTGGSEIPESQEQIAKCGLIAVTHLHIIRYLMTIRAAACLVLQAATIAESRQVRVLDRASRCTSPILARDMIRLTGRCEGAVGIVFTGLRLGEKFEELMADADQTLPTHVERLRIAGLGQAGADGALIDWVTSAASQTLSARKRVVSGFERCIAEYEMPNVGPREESAPQGSAV